MYVRKFEADTLEEALREIKRELGPDAIVLKTVTNKGLKGAFRKKRIEITAAISEKNYLKKAHVDNVLDDNQKETFYSDNASYVAKMINQHAENGAKSVPSAASAAAGYGRMGINRAVKTVSEKAKNSLDDFLSKKPARTPVVKEATSADNFVQNFDDFISLKESTSRSNREVQSGAPVPRAEHISSEYLDEQQMKIDQLEKALFELQQNVSKFERKEPTGLYQLRVTLKSLDISEYFIQNLLKKTSFELSEDEQDDPDTVFDFALREMAANIHVEMPLFSSLENEPAVTVLLSTMSSGQTSMMMKLGALKKDAVLVKLVKPGSEERESFAEKVFNMEVKRVESLSEIVSECRKAHEIGKSVFIDYRGASGEFNETKKFVDGLRRSFAQVEVLISLSAIHSELYNKNMITTYRTISDGLVVSHLDICLNFGSLFNVAQEVSRELPYKFFGTGEVIPDDIEAASPERILAGMFQL